MDLMASPLSFLKRLPFIRALWRRRPAAAPAPAREPVQEPIQEPPAPTSTVPDASTPEGAGSGAGFESAVAEAPVQTPPPAAPGEAAALQASEVPASEVPASQIGASQIGASEIGASEVGAVELDAAEAAIEPGAPIEVPPAMRAEAEALTDDADAAAWDDEDEAEPPDPDDDESLLEPDPFVHGDGAEGEDAESGAALDQRRAAARAEALSGEHRIYLSDTPGPGSLAEALNLLVEEGRVVAEFCEDGEHGPHLLYRLKH